MTMKEPCPHCGKTMVRTGMGGHKRKCAVTYEELYWAKVNRTGPRGCWIFNGAKNTTGYGMVSWYGKQNTPAHRISWQLANGPIPKGLLVLHKCDVPSCVNPKHLWLGTDADNCADKVSKDRHARGSRNHSAKLNEQQAMGILVAKGKATAKVLASKYGVGVGAITSIWSGRYWKHIQGGSNG